MADLKKTIEVVFQGTDHLSSTIKGINSDLGNINGAVSDATEPFANMAEMVWKAEAAVIALSAGFAALSIKTAGDFNEGFREITTLVDASAESMGQFSGEILDYSRNSTAAIDDINGAVYSAISAGIDYKDSLETLTQAEQLSDAGRAGLKDSLILLASTMNAYGADTDEAQRYSDSFFQTVRDGQTTIPELAQSLSAVTGTASAAGIDIETLNGSLAALTATGIPTSEAVTGLKAAISNIIKPSSEAQKAAAALGIDFSVAGMQTKGFAGFLDEVYTATGGNIETMGTLFGSVRGLNAVMVLGADASGRYAQALANQANKAGATAAAAEIMVAAMSKVNQNLINNMQATLIDIGLPMLDDYGNAVGGLVAVFQAVGDAVNNGAFSDVTAAVEKFLTDTGIKFEQFAEVLPDALAGVDYSGVIKAFEALGGEIGDAFSAMFGDINITTVEGMEAAIQKVVDGIEGLTRVTTGSLDGLEPFLRKVGEIVDELVNMDEATFDTIGQVLGLGKGINVVTDAIGSATGAMDGFGNLMNVLATTHMVKFAAGAVDSAGGITAIGAAAGKLAPLIGKAGLVVAVGALAYAFGDWIGGMTESERLMLEIEAISKETAVTHSKVADGLKKISDATGLHVNSMDDLLKMEKDGIIVYNEVTGAWEKAAEKQRDYAAEVAKVAEASITQEETMGRTIEMVQAMGIAIDGAGVSTAANTKAVDENREMYVRYYESLGNSHSAAVMLADSMGTVSTATADATTELDKAATASETLKTTMLELASAERIASMELSVEMNVAQIEADTKTITEAFGSLNTGIESTGTTLSSLAGNLTAFSSTNSSGYSEMMDLIDDESDLRQQEFDLQKDLIEAQIELIERKADAMKSGDGLIKIDSTGLEPALEMIMWQVLEKIQVRVNEEGSAMLLGM